MTAKDETVLYEVWRRCPCCKDVYDVRSYSELYGSCAGCAFCSSLEHFEPCHHGKCKDDAS